MALDSFLKLDGIKGEATTKGFEEQIQILAWSWGMSQSGSAHTGSGSGAGKVTVRDISFTHHVDASSPNLMNACVHGKHIKEALLTMRKAGGTALEYIKMHMEHVLITSVSTGASGGQDTMTESVVLSFKKFKLDYQPQDDKGAKKGGAISVVYDISKGV